MDQSEKIHENRVRRMAERQGFVLRRSRRRDPLAIDYGVYWLLRNGDLVYGDAGGRYLDEVEGFLTLDWSAKRATAGKRDRCQTRKDQNSARRNAVQVPRWLGPRGE